MKIAINQSNYISWKGYFDMIQSVDTFVLYDDVQYTKRDWRNRNKIKTCHGLKWLTVPVGVKGRYHQKIKDAIIINDGDWRSSHLKSIKEAYSKAPDYKKVLPYIENLYTTSNYNTISEVNRHFIVGICDYLDINTNIVSSAEYNLSAEDKTDRLIDICTQAGASEYVSGPAAKDYIDRDKFELAGIKLTWMDYSKYPEYPQLHGDFVHKVSIIDLLFSCGKQSINFI